MRNTALKIINDLPPGYVLLSNVGPALHVSEIRKRTSDFTRFMKWLPASKKLDGLMPGSPEAVKIYESCDSEADFDALGKTLEEVSAIQLDFADRLRTRTRNALPEDQSKQGAEVRNDQPTSGAVTDGPTRQE